MSNDRDHKQGITVKSGTLQFVKLNAKRVELRDIYHWLLKLNWFQFAGVVFITYMIVNVLYALLYLMVRDSVIEMRPGHLVDAFFFSVETFATVGYGHMYPGNFYGHLISTLELVTGMFSIALITGLIFVRFSRPVARIRFSSILVYHPFDGKPTLTFRAANLRHHPMVEAQFRLMLIRDEPILEGGRGRRYYHLKVDPEYMISFPAVLTIRHAIDEHSPLYGSTEEDMHRDDCIFAASVVCIDTALPASVQSQHQYISTDVRFDHRFTKIFTEDKKHRIIIDYARIDEIEPFPKPVAGADPAPPSDQVMEEDQPIFEETSSEVTAES